MRVSKIRLNICPRFLPQVLHDEAAYVSVKYPLNIAALVIRPVVFDEGVGVKDLASDLASPCCLLLLAYDGGQFFLTFTLGHFKESALEDVHCCSPVHVL